MMIDDIWKLTDAVI